jgi:hypothetical protein
MDRCNLHMYVSDIFRLFCFIHNLSGTFVVLGDTYNPVTRSWNLNGVALIRHQDFWFTMGMTVL